MSSIALKPIEKQSAAAPVIRELGQDEIPLIYPLIAQQNPWMSEAQFHAFLKDMLPHNYHVAGVFSGDTLIGCSGYWLRTRFWCGRQLDVDNFIIHADHQRGGVGTQLLQWLEHKAKAENCQLIVLDTYVTYTHAQRFYLNQGFALTGYHVTKMPGSTEPGKLPFSTAK